MATKYVHVPVPEERVEDVMRFILRGDLEPRMPTSAAHQPARRSPTDAFDPLQSERYPELAQMTDDDVRDASRHASTLQRRIWEELAEHPGHPFLWSELSDRLGVSRHAVPASIGRYLDRAEELYGGMRPHHEAKNAEGTRWWIWLDERVARIILEEAER